MDVVATGTGGWKRIAGLEGDKMWMVSKVEDGEAGDMSDKTTGLVFSLDHGCSVLLVV